MRPSARLPGVEWVPWRIRIFLVLLEGRVGKISCYLFHLSVLTNSRELLGDYPSFDANSVGGAAVIAESTFDDVVAVHSPLSPYATRKDWIVYSHRKEKGKGKLINEVGSCSSLLGCGGANKGSAFSWGQAQADGSNGLPSPHCEQVEVVGESFSWVLDRIIFFCKRMGLAIKGREMELLSFLASLESFSTKGNLFVDFFF